MVQQVQLVIARYREDTSWVAETGYRAVIYDKSQCGHDNSQSDSDLPPSSCVSIHSLPNQGRETHTYLTHILTRWDDLAEYTVFLQGDPFQHMEPGNGPGELKTEIARCVEKKTPFRGFAFYKLRCDGLGRPHHLHDEASRGKWAGFGRDIPVAEVYGQLFAGNVPDSFHVRAPAGLFLVRRDRILLRPRSLYETALKLIEADPNDAHNTGHAFERLWYLIFNGYAPLNKM